MGVILYRRPYFVFFGGERTANTLQTEYNIIGAATQYRTRRTRPLQLRRTWGPSIFGPLQLVLSFSVGLDP